jgi:hypothetical protein
MSGTGEERTCSPTEQEPLARFTAVAAEMLVLSSAEDRKFLTEWHAVLIEKRHCPLCDEKVLLFDHCKNYSSCWRHDDIFNLMDEDDDPHHPTLLDIMEEVYRKIRYTRTGLTYIENKLTGNQVAHLNSLAAYINKGRETRPWLGPLPVSADE